MKARILKILHREVRGLHEAAYLLGLFAIFSQVLALVRDRLLAYNFGAGEVLDVYYAAFRIPDLIFVGVASLVSVYVLIPFIAEKATDKAVKEFISNIFSFFALLIISVSAIVFIFTPQIVSSLFPGIADSETLVLLTRILLLQPMLLGLSNLFASITQINQRFILYAVSPLLYNIGIIIGILFLYPIYGIVGLVYGVILGAVFHMAIQIPFITKKKLLPSFRIFDIKEILSVISLSLPRTITLSANQIVLLLMISVASLLDSGSITVFSFSLNLQSVPLAIIGVSYSVAAFPTLARLFTNGSRKEFIIQINVAMRHIIFWSVPAIAFIIVLRAQLVRVVLGSGAFDWSDTRLTAAALALFVISLTAQAIVLLLVRGYYAAGDTKKPLLIALISAVVSLSSAYYLMMLFIESQGFRLFMESLLRVEGIPGTEVLMLPLGYSIGVLVNALLLLISFQKDFGGLTTSLSNVFWKGIFASLGAGGVSYYILSILDDVFDINTFFGIFSQGFIAGISGIIVLYILLQFVKSRELKEVSKSIHHKFWKTKAIFPEQRL